MAKVGLWHQICVENFALLKLLDKNKALTYADYLEFCMEDDDYEICPCADDGNALGVDFMDICHSRGFRTKRKYLHDEIARAKRVTLPAEE